MQAATEQQMQQTGKMTKRKMIKTIQPPLSGQPDSSSPGPLSQTAPALHLRESTSEIYAKRTRLKFGSDAATHGRQ